MYMGPSHCSPDPLHALLLWVSIPVGCIWSPHPSRVHLLSSYLPSESRKSAKGTPSFAAILHQIHFVFPLSLRTSLISPTSSTPFSILPIDISAIHTLTSRLPLSVSTQLPPQYECSTKSTPASIAAIFSYLSSDQQPWYAVSRRFFVSLNLSQLLQEPLS